MWAKSLFDMSAFVLVSGGDAKVRQIQQYLNKNYYDYTGILPTDGIYQRATNEALTYGVQAEVGLDVDTANGYFGPATASNYKSRYNSGLSDGLIKLIQMALYVNLSDYQKSNALTLPALPDFNGIWDNNSQHATAVFQDFMKLEPVSKTNPDLRTMYSLMLSNGDPSRNFYGLDMATQLTPTMIQQILDYEAYYVGRYLTGTVGAGSNERPKSVTRQEAQNIVNAGLHLVPLYQDNYPVLSYYTAQQGKTDAVKASQAAANLGLPNNTTLYFAVDLDALDEGVSSNIIPYFNDVATIINGTKYNFGVYGTRNVVARVSEETGAKFGYVSSMSSGYSGNLGFSQPVNWAFDQFFEDDNGVGSIPAVDRVAVSHLDEGVTQLIDPYTVESQWFEDTNWQIIKDGVDTGEISWNSGEIRINSETIFISISMSTSVKKTQTNLPLPMTFEIKNGKISPDFTQHYENLSELNFGSVVRANIDKLAVGIKSGTVTVFITPGTIKDTIPYAPVIEMIFSPDPIVINNGEYEISWAITFKMQFITSPLVKEPAFETAQETSWEVIREDWQPGFAINKNVATGCIIVGGIAIVILSLPADVVAGALAALGETFVLIASRIPAG